MKLKDIKVPKSFLKTIPRSKKIISISKYYNKFGTLDKPITIDKDGNLKDGYARYVVAKHMGMTDVPVEYVSKIYILACHKSDGKRYWWQVQEKDEDMFVKKVNVGDNVLVDTKKGEMDVCVVKIKRTNQPPIDKKIKYVIGF